MYSVSAWSPGICPVVPACLGRMTLPFVQETSYSMLKAPLADGGDQARMAVGGMPLTRVGASGGPGQTVAYNKTQAHHSSCMIGSLHYCAFTEILYEDEHIDILCNTVWCKPFAAENVCKSLA